MPYSETVMDLPAARKIERAKEAEAAALSADPRIANSEGASCDTHLGTSVCELARIFRKLSQQQLSFSVGGTRREGKRLHGMRFLVQASPEAWMGLRIPNRSDAAQRNAPFAGWERAKSPPNELRLKFRAACRANAPRQFVRRNQRRLGLPWGNLSRPQARSADRVPETHGHR